MRGFKGTSLAYNTTRRMCIRYCLDAEARVCLPKSTRKWNGTTELIFEISGRSDNDYAKCFSTIRNINRRNVKEEDIVVRYKSRIQKTAMISVTESETVYGVICIQDILFANNNAGLIRLKVKLLIVLKLYNKGNVDVIHNYSVERRTKYMEIRELVLRGSQREKVLEMR